MSESKVSLYTPAYPPDVGGNATSTHRLVCGLRGAGVDVRVHRSGTGTPSEPDLWRERVVHVFHAYRSGGPLLQALRRYRPPLVVSMAGTDLNHDLHDEGGRAQVVRSVCGMADALVVMHDGQSATLRETFPEGGRKVCVIPPGVEVPQISDRLQKRARELRVAWGVNHDEILFFLPAGLRSVKGPLFAIEPLERLRQKGLPIRLVVVGTVIEEEVARAFDEAAASRPWVSRESVLPFEEMNAGYVAADVVLNTSVSEGLSNALIEAMAAGRPVCARNIEGNRACIAPGRTGFLFDDVQTFVAQAEQLALQPHLRERLGDQARTSVAELFDPRREISMYADLYRRIWSNAAEPHETDGGEIDRNGQREENKSGRNVHHAECR